MFVSNSDYWSCVVFAFVGVVYSLDLLYTNEVLFYLFIYYLFLIYFLLDLTVVPKATREGRRRVGPPRVVAFELVSFSKLF